MNKITYTFKARDRMMQVRKDGGKYNLTQKQINHFKEEYAVKWGVPVNEIKVIRGLE